MDNANPIPTASTTPESFPGFQPITGNFVYCPNQFFEVCIPNCSCGATRIVAYLIRATLGWLDPNGNPLREDIRVSYRDVIEQAGISRGSIKTALAEAVAAGFIEQTGDAVAGSAGVTGQAATYRLRWNDSAEYSKDPSVFCGFFAGDGHRTPVPNQFFDVVIPRERAAITKVVGTVIRHTIGYQTQFGGRRAFAPLSYRYIAQYAKLSHGRVLSKAIRDSKASGYISCVNAGSFSHDAARQQAAEYAINWFQAAGEFKGGTKRPSGEQYKNTTSIGSGTPPENQYRKATNRKDNSKDISKQQTPVAASLLKKLIANGFDETTANTLHKTSGAEVIERQLQWIDARNPTASRTGMLRKAIVEDWPKPDSLIQKERQARHRKRDEQMAEVARQENDSVMASKKARAERKFRLVDEWKSAAREERSRWIQDAVKREASKTISELIRRQKIGTSVPHTQVLDIIADQRDLPRVVESEL